MLTTTSNICQTQYNCLVFFFSGSEYGIQEDLDYGDVESFRHGCVHLKRLFFEDAVLAGQARLRIRFGIETEVLKSGNVTSFLGALIQQAHPLIQRLPGEFDIVEQMKSEFERESL